ncbi:MAG: hypothetical protein K2X45_08000 [Phreatobacter sp.]|jgi:hypothetical protein|nr:hypothetical protein [Phreatobacter sp.]
MSLFPVTDTVVAPWFQTYADTVSDAGTWRHMHSMATRERDELSGLLPSYKRAGFDDIVKEIAAGLARCDALLRNMRAKASDHSVELVA